MKYISYKESTITETKRIENNKKYIKQQLIKEKEYLDTMFDKIDKNIKLDEDQKRIILTDEDNIMVIAGAGAGKTTTITAKVNYLIDKQKIKDKEIIVISFTNKAVNELKERINKDFNHNVKVTTFHKLAYEIIKKSSPTPPKIIKNETIILKKYIEETIKNNPNKIKEFIKIYCIYFRKWKIPIYKIITLPLINKIKEINRLINIKEYNKIINNNKNYDKLLEYFKQIINLLKSKNLTPIEIKKLKTNKKKSKHFLKFISEIYEYYNQELERTNQIDFNEMINRASKLIQEKNIHNYKYIIVDEFQDISESRMNLIKNITQKIKNKTMVVGDDWQCIYSFASSNITLFTNYQKNEKYCEIFKITKTYRNSQELIDIAGKFIQKNPSQIKKRLISNKTKEFPITILEYKNNEITSSLINAIKYIIRKYGEEKNILVLGRYKFDIDNIRNNDILKKNKNRIIYKKCKTSIDFMTVHAAKGLGYDNVILINSKNDILGFPSKKKQDDILKTLIPEENTIKYAEERRLFYVALTRTKNEIIILTPKKNESNFIKEIKKYKNVKTKRNI